MSEGRSGPGTKAATFEQQPEVEEALLGDTTVGGLDAGPEADGPQTPVFQEPGQPPH